MISFMLEVYGSRSEFCSSLGSYIPPLVRGPHRISEGIVSCLATLILCNSLFIST